MKNLFWNEEDQTVRGSFVNLLITLTILALIAVGSFVPSVAQNLEKMGVLIIGFFTMSMGIWSYKKIQENKS
jgi:hypothetical protein